MAKANRRWITIPLGVAIGLYVGLRGRSINVRSFEDVRFLAVVLLIAIPIVTAAMLFMLLVPIAIHEMGHYLAGKLVGFRFVAGVVGPLGLREERGRVVAFRARPLILGGYVAMTPPDVEDVTRRYMRFVLGGPLAGVLWVAAIFAVWCASGIPVSTQVPRGSGAQGFYQLGWILLMGASLLILPGTLFPKRIKTLGGMPTDMMRLLILRKGGDEAEATFAVLELHRLLLAGVKADELPESLLQKAELAPNEDTLRMSALQARWAVELERKPQRASEVARQIEFLVERLGKSMPKLWLDSASLVLAEQAAFGDRDPKSAENRLKGVTATLPVQRLTKAVIEAAISVLRGDPHRGERITVAERTLDDTVSRTSLSLEFERRWLGAMREGWPSEPLRPLEEREDAHRNEDHQAE